MEEARTKMWWRRSWKEGEEVAKEEGKENKVGLMFL